MTDQTKTSLNDRELARKFKAGYSVQGIADESGIPYSEVEIRLRALMVGFEMGSAPGVTREQIRKACEVFYDRNGAGGDDGKITDEDVDEMAYALEGAGVYLDE